MYCKDEEDNMVKYCSREDIERLNLYTEKFYCFAEKYHSILKEIDNEFLGFINGELSDFIEQSNISRILYNKVVEENLDTIDRFMRDAHYLIDSMHSSAECLHKVSIVLEEASSSCGNASMR